MLEAILAKTFQTTVSLSEQYAFFPLFSTFAPLSVFANHMDYVPLRYLVSCDLDNYGCNGLPYFFS